MRPLYLEILPAVQLRNFLHCVVGAGSVIVLKVGNGRKGLWFSSFREPAEQENGPTENRVGEEEENGGMEVESLELRLVLEDTQVVYTLLFAVNLHHETYEN